MDVATTRTRLQMAGLPKRFGSWHTMDVRMKGWAKNGVLDRVFEQLQAEQLARIRVEAFSLDSTSVKVHPDGTGALKKTDHKASANRVPDGTPGLYDRRGGSNRDRLCVVSGGDHDAPHGPALLEGLGPMPDCQPVLDLGMIPVVRPQPNRLHPWEYERALYKKRNEIERLFRRLQGFRRIFSRFEKLDVVFPAFLCFPLIVEALRVV